MNVTELAKWPWVEDGDSFRVKVSLFNGPAHVVSAASELARQGKRLEAADGPIPGLYRIDGGPELTVGQVMDVTFPMRR